MVSTSGGACQSCTWILKNRAPSKLSSIKQSCCKRISGGHTVSFSVHLLQQQQVGCPKSRCRVRRPLAVAWRRNERHGPTGHSTNCDGRVLVMFCHAQRQQQVLLPKTPRPATPDFVPNGLTFLFPIHPCPSSTTIFFWSRVHRTPCILQQDAAATAATCRTDGMLCRPSHN